MIVRSRIIVSVLYLLFFFFYTLSTFSLDMCTWSAGETLFKNRVHQSQRIEKRYFGCGATDSSPATAGFFKVTSITSLFLHKQKIDTNKIDLKEWERVR